MINLFARYRLKSLEPGEVKEHRITVIRTPSIFMRWLGFRPQEIVFEGGCTVWHYYPSGNRAGTSMEYLLSNFEQRGKFQNAALWMK